MIVYHADFTDAGGKAAKLVEPTLSIEMRSKSQPNCSANAGNAISSLAIIIFEKNGQSKFSVATTVDWKLDDNSLKPAGVSERDY